MRLRVLLLIALMAVVSGAAAQVTQASQPAVPETQDPSGPVQAQPVSIAGTQVHVQMSATPPEPTAEQKAQRQQWELTHPLKPEKPLPIGDAQPANIAADPNGGTRAPLPGEVDAIPSSPAAPGTFTLFRDSNMGATIKAQTSGNTGEPNAGNSGSIVFATGNWWGAISADGGQTFKYLNPYSMFPASFGGFCCDQHALYDPSRDIFIWYLQYKSSGPAGAGQNLYRLAAARPLDALQGNWEYYNVNSASNTEWDYPDLCLSNNNVYVTTNRGVFNSGSVNDAFLYRWNLDTFLTGTISGAGVDLGAAGVSNLSWKCTHGAREVMYFGAHNSTSQIRVLSWAESSGSLYPHDINLGFTWANGTHTCPTPDGRNWCGFDDGRMKTGYMQTTRQGRLVGFMWNASGAGGASNCNGTFLSCPYVEAIRMTVSDPLTDPETSPSLTVFDRNYLWASDNTSAFQFPAASPNARGDLGITAYYSSSSLDPYFLVGIDDDYHRTAGGTWDVRYVRASTQGPADQTQQRWGDYFEVQPFAPNALAWITIGQTLQGCGIAGCKESQYVIFGRGRDTHSVQRYYNPYFALALPLVER